MKTKIHVISMQNELGQKRRTKLNYDYKWFKASNPDKFLRHIKERSTHYWNAPEKNRIGKEGCNDSYYRLIQHIITKKLSNIIIAEDDCFIKEKEYSIFLENLPTELCYLNGQMVKNETSCKIYKDYPTEENSMNSIDYNECKIIGTWGIYVPHYSMLEPLWERISSHKQNKLRAFDVMIAKGQFINHYYYPSVFYCDDSGESNIRNNKPFIYDNYNKIKKKI